MGFLYETTQVRNIAPINLSARFDGQEVTVPPGISSLAKAAVPFAMNQNPIMGQADFNNPNMTGGKFLIVEVGSEYDREPLTDDEWQAHLDAPNRNDLTEVIDDHKLRKERVVISGKPRHAPARNRFEAGGVGGAGVQSIINNVVGPE